MCSLMYEFSTTIVYFQWDLWHGLPGRLLITIIEFTIFKK